MNLTSTDGHIFQIDDADHPAVSSHRWRLNRLAGYLSTNVAGRRVLLHIFLLGHAPDGLEWDHWNRDRLDNRRGNFRAVTRAINARNSDPQRNNTSGITGVRKYDARHWEAYIYVQRKFIALGRHATIEGAAAARRAAEDHYWGNAR